MSISSDSMVVTAYTKALLQSSDWDEAPAIDHYIYFEGLRFPASAWYLSLSSLHLEFAITGHKLFVPRLCTVTLMEGRHQVVKEPFPVEFLTDYRLSPKDSLDIKLDLIGIVDIEAQMASATWAWLQGRQT